MLALTSLGQLVSTLEVVAGTSKRTEKRGALAGLLRVIDPAEAPIVIGLLVGSPRQGRIGVGWASVRDLDAPMAGDPLTIVDVDRAITELAGTTGPGSQHARNDLLHALFRRATPGERSFLQRVFIGEVRTGALEGVVADAVASAAGIPAKVVRRAAMFAGDLGTVARIALEEGRPGVEAVVLSVLTPIQPMLASTSASVAEAIEAVGEASVEWKLDGARVQVHRSGDTVRIYTRNLNEVTERLPEIVRITQGFSAESFVLDGEVLGFMGGDATPEAFQDTMSRFGREDADSHEMRLVPHFFDILHRDGQDLVDSRLRERRDALVDLVGPHAIPGVVTDDPAEGEQVLEEALGRGHEGVVVKGVDTVYDAGRRGKGWRKVKPVHTLDLVVLAAEWGHGRRTGWLSNLHLGARDPRTGDFVMVGKTFKGLTDALLGWQTDRLQQLAIAEEGHVVHVRPELVVEVAIDGVQASTRYPGGVALRFARVRGYRPDREPATADTIDAVRAFRKG